MPKRTRGQKAIDKTETAIALGSLGGQIAGPVGVGVGGVAGLILGDRETVFPVDVVCIPAFQAFMIQGTPSMMYYFRAGETVLPTGGNVEDVQEVMSAVPSPQSTEPKKKKRKPSAYSKKYKAAFEKLAPDFKLKNGKWKKGGFKRCVKAAHKKAGAKK